ncbi:MAG: ABC transporter substrate-binding protein [Anaerolineales bacterium]|nr:ABC transporter substrate-binding protein [Anaerolineales bacterium]
MKKIDRDQRNRDDRVRDAYSQMQKNKLTRREFLRFASVMGASLTALGLGACQTAATSLPPQATTVPPTSGPLPTAQVIEQTVVVEREVTATPVPTPLGGIKRGGKMVSTFFFDTSRFNDPAIINSYFVSNTLRQVCDFLVRVTPELLVVPALATGWTPSADGKTWTVNLREGVTFNHGKVFNADDVVFTFERLLDPETASGFAGVANYLKPGSIEKVDDYTVNFHADRAVGDFPYHLFDYHAAVLPADWGGDFYTQPYGTGPFTIKSFKPDESITFQARTDYWDKDANGGALPYLDELEIRKYPDDAAYLDAISKGEIHLTGISSATLPKILEMPGVQPLTFQSNGFFNIVLHCNEKPFDDVRMREALKIAVERQKWVDSVELGYAIPGSDQPLSSVYAEAPGIPPTAQDIEQAKALLAEAGYPDGIDITLSFPNDETSTSTATWLAASAAEAGFRITLAPNPEYFNTWLDDWGENIIGLDNWGMRSTPSEYFNIGYASEAAWNETHYKNPDFDANLAAYDAELDPVKRKSLLSDLCTQLKADGGLLTTGHYKVLYAQSAVVKGFKMNPLGFTYYADAWLDQA